MYLSSSPHTTVRGGRWQNVADLSHFAKCCVCVCLEHYHGNTLRAEFVFRAYSFSICTCVSYFLSEEFLNSYLNHQVVLVLYLSVAVSDFQLSCTHFLALFSYFVCLLQCCAFLSFCIAGSCLFFPFVVPFCLLRSLQFQISDFASALFPCSVVCRKFSAFEGAPCGYPADHSATMEAFVKKWVRESSSGGRPVHEEFSRYPSQRHRSRPILQSRTRCTSPRDVGLDYLNFTTVDPGSSCRRTFLPEDDDRQPVAGQRVPSTTGPPATQPTYALESWDNSWQWHSRWTPDDFWPSRVHAHRKQSRLLSFLDHLSRALRSSTVSSSFRPHLAGVIVDLLPGLLPEGQGAGASSSTGPAPPGTPLPVPIKLRQKRSGTCRGLPLRWIRHDGRLHP